jgi:SSS family solute:Na+ symporter
MYAHLVNELLPPGVKGLVVAGLLAALMSSLSSVFNSSSTLVVMDFYRRWRPDAEDRELVRAGRVSILVLVAVGVAWIPYVESMSDQLYIYLQSVQAYVSPPIAAVFLAGVLWRRANASGAFATLVVGFLLGALRFVCEILVKQGVLMDPYLVSMTQVNFLHFATLLFLVSLVVLASVSLSTPPPRPEQVAFLDAPPIELPASTRRRSRRNRSLAIALVVAVLVLWVIFSPLVLAR